MPQGSEQRPTPAANGKVKRPHSRMKASLMNPRVPGSLVLIGIPSARKKVFSASSAEMAYASTLGIAVN